MCLDFYLHNMVSVCDMLVEMAEGLDLRARFVRTTAGSSSKVFCAGSFLMLLVSSTLSADASSFAFDAAFFAFLAFFLGAAAGAVAFNFPCVVYLCVQ